MADQDSVAAACRRLAGDGREEEARETLRQAELREVRDADLHFELALVAEQLGELERAILEYNLCLRDRAESPDALRRLARLRSDRGELERAVRAYRRLLEVAPADRDAVLELGAALELSGRPDEASAAYRSFLVKQEDEAIRRAADRLEAAQGRTADGPGPPEEPVSATQEPLAPTDADLVTFCGLFGGREGVHARQWVSPTGKHGYTPVNEPFTPAVARGHLMGAYTVGVYPLRMDGTVPFVAFDLDVARFAMAREGSATKGLGQLNRTVHGAARRFVDAAAMHGLTAVIEDSGWKGRHVWVFFEVPVPAAAARRLSDVLVAGAGALPAEVTLEVFPKQVRVAEGGLGNLIKLPLGIHRVTSRRSVLLDVDGRPVRDPLALLREVSRVPRDLVREVIEAAAPAAASRSGFREEPETEDRDTEAPAAATRPAERPAAGSPGLPRAVVEAPYDPGADLELQWLLDRCAVLAEVSRRARASGVLSNDERNVLTYTVGHLPRGPEAVNATLSGLLNAEPSAFLKSRLKGNPMSCPKIRARLPQVAAGVGCACRFDAGAGLYPNPLLHLQSLRSRGDLDRGVPRLTALQVERLVSDLVRLRGEIERMGRLARELEERLGEFMDGQGVTELSTAMGALRKDGSGSLYLAIQAGSPALPAPEVGHDGAVRDGAGSGSGPEAGTAGGEEGPGPAGIAPAR